MRSVACLLVVLVLAPAAGAHWYLRHSDHPGPRTLPGDGVALEGAVGAWDVLTPDLRWLRGEGQRLDVAADLPANGTWSLAVRPLACEAVPVLTWRIGGKTGSATLAGCNPALWSFNHEPVVPGGSGTGVLIGTPVAQVDTREAQEPTYYHDGTPYYNFDWYDDYYHDYEAAFGNSNPLSEASRPSTDDDGDGVPNRADGDSWLNPWLAAWAQRWGMPELARLANPFLGVEAALRQAAWDHPEMSPWQRERVDYVTTDTRGEAPRQTVLGAREVLTFTVHSDNISALVRPLVLVPRTLRDVLVEVPRAGGVAAYTVDPAGAPAAPVGWRRAHWIGPEGEAVLLQTDSDRHALHAGHTLDLSFAAAGAVPGAHWWNVTLLFGPAAPMHRFAFLPAEVVR